MSTEPATTTGADTAAGPQPPAVQQIPAERTHHGDTFVDDYAHLPTEIDAVSGSSSCRRK